jgi:2-oxoisovalerate dehydrogenase E1 component
VPGIDPVEDVLLGMLAAQREPIAGGRHKVFGRAELAIIPLTSTIASHLPRAVGLALTLGRANKLGVTVPWPTDSVVLCSFGDASANHSTAVGAINTVLHCAHQRLPMPLVLLCEDNGLGISVRTPTGWIETTYSRRPRLRYEAVEGSDVASVLDLMTDVSEWVRRERMPAFVHLRTVRYGGHAGTDVESSYRSADEMRAELLRDPILGTAHWLVSHGAADGAELLARYDDIGQRITATAEALCHEPQLPDAAAVMAPLSPRNPSAVAARAAGPPADPEARLAWFGGVLPETEGPLTVAQSINRTLADALAGDPRVMVFGEDVAAKGGVYGVTRGLVRRAGAARVFDTLLDEQSILGMALGAGLCGLVPVPEIQYLAYVHNAEDQLRGEAATMSFFSNGQYRNGMVVRIAGYGYQKGFGGHFHNDNSVAVLRDIPGLVIASPSRPADAAAMLRTCLAAASVDGTVCVFLEPIALYHVADLHEPGDGAWSEPYAAPARWAAGHVPIGQPLCYGEGTDALIITWGNGLPMSLRVQRRLAAAGVEVTVCDLRWLAPLPAAEIVAEARRAARVLVVDETRRTGGVGEGVIAVLAEAGIDVPLARVAAHDSFVPLGEAAWKVLVSEDDIERALRDL